MGSDLQSPVPPPFALPQLYSPSSWGLWGGGKGMGTLWPAEAMLLPTRSPTARRPRRHPPVPGSGQAARCRLAAALEKHARTSALPEDTRPVTWKGEERGEWRGRPRPRPPGAGHSHRALRQCRIPAAPQPVAAPPSQTEGSAPPVHRGPSMLSIPSRHRLCISLGQGRTGLRQWVLAQPKEPKTAGTPLPQTPAAKRCRPREHAAPRCPKHIRKGTWPPKALWSKEGAGGEGRRGSVSWCGREGRRSPQHGLHGASRGAAGQERGSAPTAARPRRASPRVFPSLCNYTPVSPLRTESH